METKYVFINETFVAAEDVLYRHNGQVKEVPRANFFIVNQQQQVITAKNNVLAGVIRKNILSLKNTGFELIERDFDLEELQNANEAFITSTAKHILPVLKIDGKAVGNGRTGKISEQLHALLIEKVLNH